MSGSSEVPTVDLLGSPMSALLHAVPVIRSRTGREVVLIGGLAVVCRLARPYRATSDLDTVNRRGENETPQLELLLASGVQRSGPAGVLVPTDAGLVQVDVLEVTDAELACLPDDPTDRLHVLSHAWASATATPVLMRAEGVTELQVKVAQPGPLVAMKLQSIMNRGSAKEATDLLDILRLSFDPESGPLLRKQLAEAEPQLRTDAALHAQRFFGTHVARSRRIIQALPDGQGTELDDLRLVGELLERALSEPA
ncbi:hypothetical protein [Winogradskya humida]|uniref:Nucleotidyltransferase AbiEii toxin of type IV toxin-antitoxin system n=1 Tax=Winogradskya humida TaxID=113566 RepID=A0ABQ3ZRW2_9ACTN|nr:hypothetical protein [Actinoplanes humidus]GIE21305.1 hypothetical protein Ahu01nite_044070 [Actinoplanes humidus]